MRDSLVSKLAIALIGAACFGTSASTRGQEPALPSAENVAAPSASSSVTEEYWVGVRCSEIEIATDLRDQLKLEQDEAIKVVAVVAESPAAKAGLQVHDVLLSIGDAELETPRDLMRAVRKAKGAEIKLNLIRNGELREIKITPEKRAAGSGAISLVNEPVNVQIFRPGHVLPPRVAIAAKRRELPDDMTITVSKHGKEPATIVVQQGDKHWEASEGKLDELPEEIRPHVEPMLGRMVFPLPAGAGDLLYVVNADAVHEQVKKAHDAAHRAGRDAEEAARRASRDAETAGRDVVRYAEEQAQEIVRQAKDVAKGHAREARRMAEAKVAEARRTIVSDERFRDASRNVRTLEKELNLEKRLADLERAIHDLRHDLESSHADSDTPAEEKPAAEKP